MQPNQSEKCRTREIFTQPISTEVAEWCTSPAHVHRSNAENGRHDWHSCLRFATNQYTLYGRKLFIDPNSFGHRTFPCFRFNNSAFDARHCFSMFTNKSGSIACASGVQCIWPSAAELFAGVIAWRGKSWLGNSQ